ncbi:MAG: epoxyqueuosine reductase QueH, partial [SAR324 cluster bacterium]|nr:epoxyqueuosine reductase QueH [SAR324 cluster bacterium]
MTKDKNEAYHLANYQYPTLEIPLGVKKVLLHSCCAPCVAELLLALLASKIEPVVLFYNPNIHPRQEYDIRKAENKRHADSLSVRCVDLDYDRDNWFKRVKGLEYEPERGKRCSVCFDMRFERTALYAHENGYQVFTSSLGISRWKDFAQITNCGNKAAKRHENMLYWEYNWRKKGGSMRMVEISKQENFYQQEYCGCIFSLRDTNKHR